MAAIGDGWETDAWIEAGWITGAWLVGAAAVVLEFLRPLRAVEIVAAGRAQVSTLYFNLEAAMAGIYPRIRRRRR